MATITKVECFVDADEEPLNKSSLHEINEEPPSVSLKEIAKDLKHLVNDFNAIMKEAKNKPFDSQAGLTKDEAAAIHLFTMTGNKSDRPVFIHLNRALRSGSPKELKPWLSYLKMLVSGLSKLPPTESTVYRGAPKNISDKYQNECIWGGFSLCTNRQNELTKFLDKSPEHTIFKIDCKNGINLHKFSHNQEENEIILMPGTCLRVKEKSISGKGAHLVHLVEVPGKNSLISTLIGTPPSTVETFSISEASNSSTIQSVTPIPLKRPHSKMNIMTSCIFLGAYSIKLVEVRLCLMF